MPECSCGRELFTPESGDFHLVPSRPVTIPLCEDCDRAEVRLTLPNLGFAFSLLDDDDELGYN